MSENKSVTNDNDALLEALSPIVTKLIDKNYESSQDKISKQMAPLIGSAIREQIKSQKDDVVDALYPVMGNMISRYVTKTLEETLNTINQQIENNLSFKSLSRKIRAKLKGVSEAQLLLDENSTSNIEALLLIHKETGLVLAEAHNPETPLHEPEMVASMMSAIRSFINDWIDKNEQGNELGEIEYGGHKIVIESSAYSYLAVIVDGAAYLKTYDNIRNTLASIVSEHGEDIREFNGDLRSFPNIEIYKKISSLLSIDKEITKQPIKKNPIIFIIPLLILGLISWSSYNSYVDDSITQSINKAIYINPHLSLYKIDITTKDLEVTLKGQVPLKYYKNLVENIVEKQTKIKDIKNNIIILATQNDPMQISSNISYFLNGLNMKDGINLHYIYNYPNLKIFGEVWDLAHKNIVIKNINKNIAVENIDFKIDITPPHIKKIIYFEKGSAKISLENEIKLIELSKKLYYFDNNSTLHVEGYSDNSGSFQAKKHTVDNRVKNVISFLKTKANVSQNINALSHYSPPKNSNQSITPKNARCVIIHLDKGE